MIDLLNEKVMKRIKGYKRITAVILAFVSAYGSLTYEIVMSDMEFWPKIFLLLSQWSMALAGGLGIEGRVREMTRGTDQGGGKQ